jgi:hypothetical protein
MGDRILYLDIDNVLNDDAWIFSDERDSRQKELFHEAKRSGKSARLATAALDLLPQYTQYIRKMVSTTSCSIVVCSAWRKMFSLEELNELFIPHGFQAIRCTPRLRIPAKDTRIHAILEDVRIHNPSDWCVLDNEVCPYDVHGHGVFIDDGITPEIFNNTCDVLLGISLTTPSSTDLETPRYAPSWWGFRENVCRVLSNHAGTVIRPDDVETYLWDILHGGHK